jgi:hypothetical protein
MPNKYLQQNAFLAGNKFLYREKANKGDNSTSKSSIIYLRTNEYYALISNCSTDKFLTLHPRDITYTGRFSDFISRLLFLTNIKHKN